MEEKIKVIVSDEAVRLMERVFGMDVFDKTKNEDGSWVCGIDRKLYDDFMELVPDGVDFSKFLIGVLTVFEAAGYGQEIRNLLKGMS